MPTTLHAVFSPWASSASIRVNWTWAEVQLHLFKNGLPVGSGLGSAVQGHPCAAVAWLANTLGRLGIPFRKGEIILSGALAPLVPVAPGDFVSLSLSGMGEMHLNFVP